MLLIARIAVMSVGDGYMTFRPLFPHSCILESEHPMVLTKHQTSTDLFSYPEYTYLPLL